MHPSGYTALSMQRASSQGIVAAAALVAFTATNAIAGSAHYRNAVLGDNPVGYWRFEETSGITAADSSASTQNENIIGGVTLGVAGAFADSSRAVSLNGTTGNIRINDNGASPLDVTTLTLEAWIRPTNLGSESMIINKESVYEVGMHSAVLESAVEATDPNGWYWLGTSTISLNVWTHIAVTYDGTAVRHFRNGVLTFTNASASPSGSILTNNESLRIGARGGNGTGFSFFQGSIDEVAIYGSALSASQIASHYQAASFSAGGSWLNNSNTNNAWSTGSNWGSGVQPTSLDNATFNLAGPYSVNLTPSAAANEISVSNGNVTFAIGGNTLTAAGALNVMASGAAATFSGPGNVSLGSNSRVSNGTATIDSGAQVQMGGSAYFAIGGNGSLATTGTGTLNVTGAGSKLTIGGGSMEVGEGPSSTGTLNITSGGQVAVGTYVSVAPLTTGNGTINVGGTGSSLTATSYIDIGKHPSTANGGVGTININPGGLVETQGYTRVFNATSLLHLNGGTLKTGSLDLAGNASRLDWDAGTIELTNSDAVIGRSGAPFNTFGTDTLVVGAGKNLILSKTNALLQVGDNVSTFSSLTVNSGGSVTLPRLVAGGGSSTSGNIFVDGATATLNATTIDLGPGGKGTLNVRNGGTAAVTGTTKVYTADATSKIEIASGGTLKTGSLDLGGNSSRLSWISGTLWLTGNTTNATGAIVIPNGGTLKGSGTVSSIVSVAAAGTATIEAIGTLSNAVNQGYSVDSGRALDITGGTVQLGGDNGSGSAMFGELYVRAGAIFDNRDTTGVGAAGGKFRLRGGELRMTNYSDNTSNYGLVATSDALTLIEGYGTLSARVNLSGYVSGYTPFTLQSSAGILNVTGAVGSGGTVQALAGSTLILNGGNGPYTPVTTLSAAGDIVLGANFNATTTSITAGGSLNLGGNTLTSTNFSSAGTLKGTGTVNGSVVVVTGGHVAPGNSPGTMNVTGNYIPAPGSYLDIEIAGTTPGTLFDRLLITGTATLAGNLNIDVINGFTPTLWESYTILDAASLTGTFAGLPNGQMFAADGYDWSIAYNNAAGTVTLTALPEPASFGMIGIAAIVMLRRRRVA